MKRYEIFDAEAGRINALLAPIIACWDVTQRCQQTCIFCYNPSDLRDGRKRISHPNIEHQLRIIDELARAGIIEIDLMGGDPLSIPPETLKILVARAVEQGMLVNVVTNGIGAGLRFRKEVAPLIKDIGFSIHGSNPETHNRIVGVPAFEIAVGNLVEVARTTKCGVGVLFSAIRSNMSELEATVRMVIERLGEHREKLRFFYLNRMVCHEGTNAGSNKSETNITLQEHWELIKTLIRMKREFPWVSFETTDSFPSCVIAKLYAQDVEFKKQFTLEETLAAIGVCYFGKTNIAIKANGDATICTISREEHAIENILRVPLRRIWAGALLSLYHSLKWMPESCSPCDYLARCLGACKMGKKGPFGIDRVFGEDDVPMLRESAATSEEVVLSKLTVDGDEFRIRKEQEGHLVYPVGKGRIFRPHQAAIVSERELEGLKEGHAGTVKQLRILLKGRPKPIAVQKLQRAHLG